MLSRHELLSRRTVTSCPSRAKTARRPCVVRSAGHAANDRDALSPAVARVFTANGIPLDQPELDAFMQASPDLIEPQQLELLGANVKVLARFLSPVEIRTVSAAAPEALTTADLGAWFEFLKQYGFLDEQISHLLCQAPQALARANLVSAGQALATMREVGLDEGTSRAFIANYPQLLHSSREEIVSILRTLSRFSSGINITC